jgi:hypothetical protein
MTTIELTDEQVLEALRQMPPEKQTTVLRRFYERSFQSWRDGMAYGAEGARAAARARGRDWDAMSEAEREAFLDEVLHEA